jgi:hypothetical protein
MGPFGCRQRLRTSESLPRSYLALPLHKTPESAMRVDVILWFRFSTVATE